MATRNEWILDTSGAPTIDPRHRPAARYSVRYINHGYSAAEKFTTSDEALTFARRVGFEAAIDGPDGLSATWHPINGATRYNMAAAR